MSGTHVHKLARRYDSLFIAVCEDQEKHGLSLDDFEIFDRTATRHTKGKGIHKQVDQLCSWISKQIS